MNSKAMSLWTSTWDSSVHETEYAAKRIKSAKSAKLTPVRINAEDMYGHFQGSHGRYETFLDTCPCGDFHRAHLPCKHIYRLAMELGILGNSDMQTDSLCIATPRNDIQESSFEELISILESGGPSIIEAYANYQFKRGTRFVVDTSVPEHQFLLDHAFWEICEEPTSLFFQKLNKKDTLNALLSNGITPPKGISASSLVEWTLSNHKTEINTLFPNRRECTFSRKYDIYHHKLYLYCHRVVSPYSYLANRPVVVNMSGTTYDIPDDEINLLYYKNGHTFDLDIQNNPFILTF